MNKVLLETMIEVEQKFSVTNLQELQLLLQQAGFQRQDTRQQIDCYFQHPVRDYSQTDEALRIRQDGDDWLVSYKGPKKNGPLKQRFELELPLKPLENTLSSWTELLQRLGFQRVAKVEKTRETFRSAKQPGLTVVLDRLRDLDGGHFFCEIEMLTQENQTSDAVRTIESIASSLNLDQPVTQSYLEMILNNGQR